MSLIIDRLQTQVAALRLVEGAANLPVLQDSGPRAMPAAYVVPLAESAARDAFGAGASSQQITTRLGVIYAVANRRDVRGEAAQSDLRGLRDSAHAALVGWPPSPDDSPLEYQAGRLLQLTDGVLWWQDDFLTERHERAL